MDRLLAWVLFGGTFDPPHDGHVAIARAALAQTGARRLLVIPALRSPHKAAREPAPAADRLAMCREAFRGIGRVEVSSIEIDRPPPSYTISTLETLASTHPEVGTWWLLMGEDSLADVPRWHRATDLVSRCRLLVAPRKGGKGGTDPDSFHKKQLGSVPISMKPVEISASAIRDSIRGTGEAAGLKPEVLEWIQGRGLYGCA